MHMRDDTPSLLTKIYSFYHINYIALLYLDKKKSLFIFYPSI